MAIAVRMRALVGTWVDSVSPSDTPWQPLSRQASPRSLLAGVHCDFGALGEAVGAKSAVNYP